MKTFDYTTFPAKLLTPEMVGLLAALHEYRGKQEHFATAKADVLDALQTVARIQSTSASNRIEGIFTSDERLKKLMEEKSEPLTRNEREIAGYRDVLAAIHENFANIPVTPNTILQLHRDLYAFQASGMGGTWKATDNVIVQTGTAGKRTVRFTPVAALATPEAMTALCEAYRRALGEGVFDPLLLSAIFVFDFLCIHPFNDGNGRMSRLLTLLLLYQNGYQVGKFISLEMLIEHSRESYYEALRASSDGWADNRGDYLPFLRYHLGIVLKAYREFEERVSGVLAQKLTKTQRIRRLFESRLGKISKRDVQEYCPDVSVTMIEHTLKQLLDAGFIGKVGSGKNTAYVKK